MALEIIVSLEKDHYFMAEALNEARAAGKRDEVPIGAVLVERASGTIIARAGNRTREACDPTAHAEILAIRDACRIANAQRIPGFDLYVTLEPCPMCAAAISFARIDRVVFAATDPKSGGVVSGPRYYDFSQLHHKPEIVPNVEAGQSTALLQDFFRSKRNRTLSHQDTSP